MRVRPISLLRIMLNSSPNTPCDSCTRAAGFANYGGSDLGDVVATLRNISEGDEEAWLRE